MNDKEEERQYEQEKAWEDEQAHLASEDARVEAENRAKAEAEHAREARFEPHGLEDCSECKPEERLRTDKVVLEPKNTLMGEFQKERTEAISEMFDNEEYGIYPTTKFFIKLDNCVRELLAKVQKHRLDRPDREKLRDIISDARLTAYQDAIAGYSAFRIGNMDYEKQILALFPDEKELRKKDKGHIK